MADSSPLDLKENLKDNFVAFIDVMGFSNLVNKNNVSSLEEYFTRITKVLEEIKIDKKEIQSFLISDSIILIAPTGVNSLRQLIIAIRRIQSSLLWKKILLRGAVSFGQVYYNPDKNIIVGKGFIRAFLLEKEAVYPRVIIDPKIIQIMDQDKIGFLKDINRGLDNQTEDRLIYNKSVYSRLTEDSIFIDYANKTIKDEIISGNIKTVYTLIKENIYSEQHLFTKYVWLRDYFLEWMYLKKSQIALKIELPAKALRKSLDIYINKFERL